MDPNLRFPQAWELEVWTHAHACEDVKFCKKSLEVIWVTHGSTGGNEGLGTANSHGERAASLWRQHIPPHGSTGLHPQQELNAPPKQLWQHGAGEKLSRGEGTLTQEQWESCCCPRGRRNLAQASLASRVPHKNNPSSQELWFNPEWWARERSNGKGEQTGTMAQPRVGHSPLGPRERFYRKPELKMKEKGRLMVLWINDKNQNKNTNFHNAHAHTKKKMLLSVNKV